MAAHDDAAQPEANTAAPASTATGPPPIGKVIKSVLKILGFYACLVRWAVLQKRVLSTEYQPAPGLEGRGPGRFASLTAFNGCVAIVAAIVGLVLHLLVGGPLAPFKAFWRPASSSVLVVPIMTLCVHYDGAPLMLLGEHIAPLSVVVVGAFTNSIRCKPNEHVAVGLVTLGVGLFLMKEGKRPTVEEAMRSGDRGHMVMAALSMLASAATIIPWSALPGFLLAATRSIFDAFTYAELDKIVRRQGVSPYYTMAMVNICFVGFATLFLLADLAYRGGGLELATMVAFVQRYPGVRLDLASFAFAQASAQAFIHSIIDEVGSLVSVVCTSTMRKMMMLWLYMLHYKSPIQWWQQVGLLLYSLGAVLLIELGLRSEGEGKVKKKLERNK